MKDWLVGKVVFPTIVPHFSPLPPSAKTLAAIEAGRDIGAELLQSVREAKQILFPDGFPCGWDERDAKV